MGNIRLYLRIIFLQLRGQLEYPLNAVVGFINQFIVFFLEFTAMWALFYRFGQIKGWTFNEVFLTYGIINLSFAMAEVLMRGFETNMTSLIRNGDYDRYLLRPRNTVLQISAFSFQFVRLGRAMQSIVVLCIGIVMNAGSITGVEWIILLFTVVGGWLLYASLYIITGIISFKIMQYTEFMSIFIQGSVSTMQYPMTIFPAWIRNIFTYVLPATTVSYFPISAILDKSTSVPRIVGFGAPAVCYIFFIISIWIFFKVEKSYVSSGS
ncbi:ABC transporter permease [Paenibacillus tengchongensis]|uniref:ABC transporter permease n=1 Tax=Paenibacillus tengchongensis TaxID=2608684 RepID=UPI00124F20D9|nr:ABC-2 family transporter protein [Paenibacillus tengchongensis]